MIGESINTLHISTTGMKLLSMKGNKIKEWGSIPLKSGMVKNGLILEPKTVGAAIDELFKSTKVSKKSVVVTVTGLPFTYRILEMPEMKSHLINEAIIRAAKNEMTLPIDNLYLSWQAIGNTDGEQS